MELFAVHIADVGLLRRTGRCRSRGVQLGVRGVVLGADGVVLPVRADGDGPQQVGAVDIHACIPQDAQSLLMGVAILVVHPAGDDSHFRQDRVQEDIAGGGGRTVVAHLQHIHLEVGPAVDEVPFGVGFHIAGEQKAGGTIINAEDNGGIVGVTVLRHRAQLGDGCPAQLPGSAHSGHLYL